MFHVRALTSGPWRAVDVVDSQGNKVGERPLAMATEHGRWCVDNQPIDVIPGLCVTFSDVNDALWFIGQGRAQWFGVEPGNVITFALERDAEFFVRKKLGEIMSQREAEEYFADMQAEFERRNQDYPVQQATFGEEEDDMLKTKIENKAVTKPAETKKPAPKPAAKNGKKGK